MYIVKGDENKVKQSTVRPTDDEIEHTVKIYSNSLFKLCFTLLCNRCDAEDAVSDTFFKYITKSPVFRDAEHQKAWPLHVAVNTCKDMKKFRFKHETINFDDIHNIAQTEPERNILDEVLHLPDKYKKVIHLHYIEGYQTKEIAEILSISPAAARKRLQYARDLLKLEYGKGDSDERA